MEVDIAVCIVSDLLRLVHLVSLRYSRATPVRHAPSHLLPIQTMSNRFRSNSGSVQKRMFRHCPVLSSKMRNGDFDYALRVELVSLLEKSPIPLPSKLLLTFGLHRYTCEQEPAVIKRCY